jgi:hypothetical protein
MRRRALPTNAGRDGRDNAFAQIERIRSCHQGWPPFQGCTTSYRNFSHPGCGQAEFDRDQYQCQRENSHEAIYINGYVASGGTEVDRSMVKSCLSAQG